MKQYLQKEDDFVRVISDLKSPINAQIVALETFLKSASAKISKNDRDLIKLTLSSCRISQQFIETYCKINQLTYEKININYSKFDFSEVLRAIIEEMEILFKYYDINKNINIQDEIIIMADKNLIKKVVQTFLYIMANSSYKKTTLYIEALVRKDILYTTIKNSSAFIKPEISKHIFDRNNNQNSFYSKPIFNLGLYFSKEIIKAHFGRVNFISQNDNKNIITFCVPIK